MGSKSRPFYTTGGACIRECSNRGDRCKTCLNRSDWELPETCTLGSIATWVELQDKDYLALARVKHIILQKGVFAKVKRDDILDILREELDESLEESGERSS